MSVMITEFFIIVVIIMVYSTVNLRPIHVISKENRVSTQINGSVVLDFKILNLRRERIIYYPTFITSHKCSAPTR